MTNKLCLSKPLEDAGYADWLVVSAEREVEPRHSQADQEQVVDQELQNHSLLRTKHSTRTKHSKGEIFEGSHLNTASRLDHSFRSDHLIPAESFRAASKVSLVRSFKTRVPTSRDDLSESAAIEVASIEDLRAAELQVRPRDRGTTPDRTKRPLMGFIPTLRTLRDTSFRR